MNLRCMNMDVKMMRVRKYETGQKGKRLRCGAEGVVRGMCGGLRASIRLEPIEALRLALREESFEFAFTAEPVGEPDHAAVESVAAARFPAAGSEHGHEGEFADPCDMS